MFGWWGNKAKKEFESTDYSPGRDYMKRIREREAAEKKRFEKWKKQLNTKNTYTHVGSAVSSGTFSNTYISTNNTTTSLADAKIRIDGSKNGTMQVDVPLVVNGRDVMKELDELREAMLLITRDLKLEEHYPELKQAYDDYMELYRGIKIADKLTNTGLE